MTDRATTVQDVGARLSGRQILHGVNLAVRPGVTALVGRNGAGKTTLIRVLTGVLKPSAGTVARGDESIWSSAATMREHRRTLGWLPQEPGYPPRMEVRDFVTYAGWLKEIPPNQRQACVDAAIEVADLGDREGVRLGQLSGGQRRRAALAASVVGSPELVLLDEPTNGLDPLQRARFLDQVTTLAQTAAVVLATHLLEDVSMAADRWCALAAGAVVASGNVDRSSPEGVAKTTASIREALAASGTEA